MQKIIETQYVKYLYVEYNINNDIQTEDNIHRGKILNLLK